jgi:tRNA threonylcarbamoyladenosine biosynthesis protein TsaE
VHVDAYRLGALAEVDDLDLDATLEESVTVVEWGGGLVEGLSDDYLEIVITRSVEPGDETRQVAMTGMGSRWADVDLGSLVGGPT